MHGETSGVFVWLCCMHWIGDNVVCLFSAKYHSNNIDLCVGEIFENEERKIAFAACNAIWISERRECWDCTKKHLERLLASALWIVKKWQISKWRFHLGRSTALWTAFWQLYVYLSDRKPKDYNWGDCWEVENR